MFYSVFVPFSSTNHEPAKKLRNELRRAALGCACGVQCWSRICLRIREEDSREHKRDNCGCA